MPKKKANASTVRAGHYRANLSHTSSMRVRRQKNEAGIRTSSIGPSSNGASPILGLVVSSGFSGMTLTAIWTPTGAEAVDPDNGKER